MICYLKASRCNNCQNVFGAVLDWTVEIDWKVRERNMEMTIATGWNRTGAAKVKDLDLCGIYFSAVPINA